jgi:hypothetical protein
MVISTGQVPGKTKSDLGTSRRISSLRAHSMQLYRSNRTVTEKSPSPGSYPIPAIVKHNRKKCLLDTLIPGARQQISSNEKQRCPK